MTTQKIVSFVDYEQHTLATDGSDRNATFAMLGLVGELGEIVEAFDLTKVDSQSDEESYALELLLEFQKLATKVEAHKKLLRAKQIILTEPSALGRVAEEIGGLYWYLNSLAISQELSMQTIVLANQTLLAKRFSANPNWLTGGLKLH